MKNNINKYKKSRLGDYIIFCDICGQPCWHSESVKLDKYTGRGGLVVCLKDADPIDYGLVPYKIPAEKPVPIVRVNNFNDSVNIEETFSPITNYETQNPLNTDPVTDGGSSSSSAWENLNEDTWDNWTLPWGN